MEIQFTIFGIVILCYLYFPGLILKKFYFKGPFSKQFNWGPFLEKFLTCVFAGIFVHIIFFLILWVLNLCLDLIVLLWGIFFKSCPIQDVNIDGIYTKMLNYFNEISKNNSPISTTGDVINFIQYWLITCGLSMISGYGVYRIIRALKFDIKFKIFRYANLWHYYFNGEIIKITNSQKETKENAEREIHMKWNGTFITITKDSENGIIQYTGMLESYELSHSDCLLQSIYLKFPFIKTYNEEYDDDCKTITSEKEYILIPYDDKVLDLRIQYNYLEGGASQPRKRKYTVWFFSIYSILSIIVPLTQYQKIGIPKSIILMGLIFLDLLIIIGLFNYFSHNNTEYSEREIAFSKGSLIASSIIATALICLIIKAFIY